MIGVAEMEKTSEKLLEKILDRNNLYGSVRGVKSFVYSLPSYGKSTLNLLIFVR